MITYNAFKPERNLWRDVIVVTLNKRIGYTKAVLKALARCATANRFKILFHCEPGHPDVVSAAKSYPYNKEVVVNPHQLGCTNNTFAALDHGFKLSKFVVALEDDVVPGPDFLRLIRYLGTTYENDSSVFSVCGYSHEVPAPKDYFTLRRTLGFICWGWGTWIDRWESIRSELHPPSNVSWDTAIHWLVGSTKSFVYPALSRVQNIGACNGTWVLDSTWQKHMQRTRVWTGCLPRRSWDEPYTEVKS